MQTVMRSTPARPVPPPPRAAARDGYWEDCRNSIGIARLLVQEGRAEALVATACRLAVECACRAALEQANLPFEGDVDAALRRLGCYDVVGPMAPAGGAVARLGSAEKVVGWVAVYLRGIAPERPWGF